MRLNIVDAQQALGFLTEQTSHIEAEVYRTQYAEIQYPSLIPVDESAPEWAKSITFFSSDTVGKAKWFNHMATDMPLADVNRTKYESGIEMSAIGYRYTLEEIGQAMMTGQPLASDRAEGARRASEEFIDSVAFLGDALVGYTGLANDANVTRVDAPADGTGASRSWSSKTAEQIVRDINDALSGVHTGSNAVEVSDTILVPLSAMSILASKMMANSDRSVLSYIMENNVYTQMTGQPITVRAILGLDTAGTGGVGRMVVYRRDPRVVKLHMPMRHRFLPVWQTGPLTFDVPGIFRIGGVEVRRPGAMRYVDGITPVPT